MFFQKMTNIFSFLQDSSTKNVYKNKYQENNIRLSIHINQKQRHCLYDNRESMKTPKKADTVLLCRMTIPMTQLCAMLPETA